MGLIEFKDLPDVSTPINSASLNNNFNELNNIISKKTLLWSNDNLDNFPETTINLSSGDYNMLQIFYIRDASDKTVLMSQFTLKGYGFWLDSFLNGTSLWRRAIGRISDTSYRVYQCNKYNGGSSTITMDNTALIPIAIYGIKEEIN